MQENRDQPTPQGDEGTPTGPLAPQPGSAAPPSTAQSGIVPPELRPTGAQPLPPAQQAAPAVMSGYRPRRTPLLGPLLLIGVGVVFLLINLGVLSEDAWGQLFQLWPLLLIAFGLDLLIGRRNPVLSIVIVVLVIGGGAALIYANGGWWSGKVLSTTWDADKGTATSANVELSMGVARLNIDAITSETSKVLMSALDYYENQPAPEHSTSSEGDTVKVLISQRTNNISGWPFFSGSKGLNWDVHLNKQIPTKLTLNSGTGTTDLDLEQLKVTDLTLRAGTGSITVVFPSSAGSTNAVINGGVGSLDLAIPSGVEAHIVVNTGIGGVDVNSRFASKGDHVYESSGYSKEPKNKLDLEVHAGVGGINISSR